jgi:pimeloyl-ACP methyl ester carboxylesterase
VIPEFVTVEHGGRTLRIEHAWIAPARRQQPLLVFLHEGLGSLSMWRGFPQQLCDALGWRGLVYSRPGYGRSTARSADERWGPDFMHRQAHELLPALLAALQVREPVVLFGHSDGGSIALLAAARAALDTAAPRVAALVVLAPHLFVEPISLRSIARARELYLGGELRARLARHHDDVDSAFWGWNDIWLDPAFSRWDITSSLNYIECPVLAVQGVDDEYGTLAQIEGIAAAVPGTELLTLDGCGHSPHRDQPEALIGAVTAFLQARCPPCHPCPHPPHEETTP